VFDTNLWIRENKDSQQQLLAHAVRALGLPPEGEEGRRSAAEIFSTILNASSAFRELRKRLASMESPTVRFARLKSAWKAETAATSSLSRVYGSHAYREIIAMGEDALPLIFRELETDPDWWFGALSAITGQNPVAPASAGRLHEMTQAWLRWRSERERALPGEGKS
jgi:hypothetical protein